MCLSANGTFALSFRTADAFVTPPSNYMTCMHPIAILCNVLTCMQTCHRNKPVLQCETNPLRKPTTNTENMRSCTQRRLVVHRRSVRSVYYISKCSCNIRMTIQYVEPQEPRALLELHGQELSDSLSHSMEFSNTFLFRMIFF